MKKRILCILTTIVATSAQAEQPIRKTAIPNEFIISLRSPIKKSQIEQLAYNGLNIVQFLKSPTNPQPLLLIKAASVLQNSSHIKRKIEESLPNYNWSEPNYLYEGNLYDRIQYFGIPQDPRFNEQYHHAVMKNVEAWDLEKGRRNIIVAVTDDGFSVDHEDLAHSFYINTNEIAGNGIDDDNNGYIDDFMGWDMIANDNDVNASGDHGTHVVGIIAAAADNNKGVTGTASGVKIMPLKIYDGSWTSAAVAGAYMYAADNGANIISTSYNVDGLVNDRVYREAVKYAYDQGVLIFNSAGNSNIDNPARITIEEIVLVCSTIADTLSNDRKSEFSNYGFNIHICAPGGGGNAGILSTVRDDSYSRMSGTSMAAPNAAAVAALIWSAHPSWSRGEVLTQLLGTADSIDHLNSFYQFKLGTGRVNSLRALTEEHQPTSVKRVAEIVNGVVPNGISKLTVQLSGTIEPTSALNTNNWQIISAGTDGIFATEDDILLPVAVANHTIDTSTQIQLQTNRFNSGVKYKLVAKAALLDHLNTQLDGNGDGSPGDDYHLEFRAQ